MNYVLKCKNCEILLFCYELIFKLHYHIIKSHYILVNGNQLKICCCILYVLCRYQKSKLLKFDSPESKYLTLSLGEKMNQR